MEGWNTTSNSKNKDHAGSCLSPGWSSRRVVATPGMHTRSAHVLILTVCRAHQRAEGPSQRVSEGSQNREKERHLGP